ncbi:MAG: sugar phosphate isomerase/epimerase family protein [bacterium]
MTWGYALVWAGQFLTRDADPLMARLKFLAHYGLTTTGVGLDELDRLSPAQRDGLRGYLAAHDVRLPLIVGAGWLAPDRAALRRRTDELLGKLERYAPLARCPLVTTGGGTVHRFTRAPALPGQMDLLAEALAPVAARCHALGIPFGIENHGDYYCSDLAALCRRVPHLGIFLDTGNTYLIGEAPLPAVREAAPFTVGTHFKDHVVAPRPEARPLHFEVGAAVIGEGDVPLREAYDLLLRFAPDPGRLTMEIELIPPSFKGNDPVEAFERSLAFVRSLPPPLKA